MNKKHMLSLASLALISLNASEFNGYSYFGVASMKSTYQELYTFTKTQSDDIVAGDSVKMESIATSPVYTSGSIIKINDYFDFSMDFLSTLKPDAVDESWINETQNRIVQNNNSDAMYSGMVFLLQYKITPKHRLVGGLDYRLNSFKRYNFEIGSTTSGSVYGVIEERSSTLMGSFGYWFESTTAAKNDTRFMANIIYGKPVYQSVQNTSASGEINMDNESGYNYDMTAYAGYTIFDGVEIGAYTSYSFMKRDGQKIPNPQDPSQMIVWPKNETELVSVGLKIIWNFNQ